MSHPSNPQDKESLQVFALLFDFGQQTTGLNHIKISHFWSEKFNILVQLIQLFSFVFVCNFESWPVRWQGMYQSSYLSLVAGDLGAIYFNELYSDASRRAIYGGGWIITVGVLFVFYIIMRFVIPMPVLTRVHFQRYFFKIVHFMYLPTALGLLPIAICQYDTCSASGQQLIVSILTLGVIGFYLIGFPVYLIIHAYRHVISTDSETYDEFIRLKEMEYLLGVSHAWLTEKLYLFSSFRSSWLRVYHKSVYYCFILALITVHAALNLNNSIKLLVLLGISVVFSLYITVFPVYRCLSSSYLYAFTMWLISANFFIGFLKAVGYNSQTMVDENLVNIIIAINVTGLVLILIILLMVLVFRAKWDVGIDTVKQLAIAYRFLLADLRNAQKMILTLRTYNSFRFVKTDPIEKMIDILTEHYKLLSKENHPLQYTVVEQLDILSFMKLQVKEVTLLPSKKLERDFGLLVKVVNRRWREQILISPVKRKLLLKLGVLKMFLGKMITKPFNSGEDSNYLEKGEATKGEYDIGKLYQDFEDLESSREMVIDTKRDNENGAIGEIDDAINKNDLNRLIKITGDQITYEDSQILHYLKSVWTRIGLEKLPQNLHSQLFA